MAPALPSNTHIVVSPPPPHVDEQCELGGACIIGFSTKLDDANASACGVATQRMRRQYGEDGDGDDDYGFGFGFSTPSPNGSDVSESAPVQVSAAQAADLARNSHFYVAGGGANCEELSPDAVLGVGWTGSRPNFAPGAKVFATFKCRANGSELLDLDADDDDAGGGKDDDDKRSRSRRGDDGATGEGTDAVTNAAKDKLKKLLADDFGLSSDDVKMYAALFRDAAAKAPRPDAGPGPAEDNGGAGTYDDAESTEVAAEADDDTDIGRPVEAEFRSRRQATLVVTTGSSYCQVSGNCVSDGAGSHGNNEACTIQVQTTGTISSPEFNTESGYDYITIGGRRYSGDRGPNDVAVFAGSTFTWRSDSSVTRPGWRLCLAAGANTGGCGEHSSCTSSQYCNDANVCSPCERCGPFRDAVDGTCPSNCEADAVTGPDASIRLVAGDGVLSGRLEVNIGGRWGTVCDDDFGSDDAAVVCRQLGLSGGAVGDAFGSGAILMDNVRCRGSESRIQSCPFVSDHNCGHSEDVAITCGAAVVDVTTASPTQPATAAICGDTSLFANLYRAGEVATWQFTARTATLVNFSTCGTAGEDTILFVGGTRYDRDRCGYNEDAAIAVAANQVVSVGVRFYSSSQGRVFLAVNCSASQAPSPAPTRRFFSPEDHADGDLGASSDSSPQALSQEDQLAQCQARAFISMTGNLSRTITITADGVPDKVIRRDASFVDIDYYTDSACKTPFTVDDMHYTERHTWDTSPINMPHVALGPPLGVVRTLQCTLARKPVPLAGSFFGWRTSWPSSLSCMLLRAGCVVYSTLQFCTGYAPVGQFRRAVDENDDQTCTRSDVRNKRHGCIQLINPLSGKYWYDTAYAACKNPSKCDSRKNDIVKQALEVRDIVIEAKDWLEVATIAQALAIGIAFFLHFCFETVYGGNVFKTKATWLFFVAKNVMVFLAFCANLHLGTMLLNAEIKSADGLGMREWLSNFIEYECFDAGGTVVLVEVRSFVEETATEMILIAFISKKCSNSHCAKCSIFVAPVPRVGPFALFRHALHSVSHESVCADATVSRQF